MESFYRYIILENLRYFLEPFNSSEPLYFGHRFRAYVDSGYMQGGSGKQFSALPNRITHRFECR